MPDLALSQGASEASPFPSYIRLFELYRWWVESPPRYAGQQVFVFLTGKVCARRGLFATVMRLRLIRLAREV